MAQVSNPATLTSVASVFGAGSLSTFAKGGGKVPNIAHLSGIGVGPVTLAAFAGKIYPVIALPVLGALHAVGTPATATATINYSSAGSATGTGGASGTWLLAGFNTNYEIMFNKTTGTTPTGDSVNTWLALSSTRSWTLSVSNNIKTCTGYIAIRDTVANVELANGVMSIEADSS